VNTSATPPQPPGAGARGGQRFGHVTRRRPGAGPGGQHGGYQVTDDETSTAYWFSSADIVTEGLRTLRPGERVRFLIDHTCPGHASYVIRLDLPDIAEYYT
jgi:hypothetical protein